MSGCATTFITRVSLERVGSFRLSLNTDRKPPVWSRCPRLSTMVCSEDQSIPKVAALAVTELVWPVSKRTETSSLSTRKLNPHSASRPWRVAVFSLSVVITIVISAIALRHNILTLGYALLQLPKDTILNRVCLLPPSAMLFEKR
jgi:hypothetical protein